MIPQNMSSKTWSNASIVEARNILTEVETTRENFKAIVEADARLSVNPIARQQP